MIVNCDKVGLFNYFVCLAVLSRYDVMMYYIFFFQAEDGIRDLVRSRGLGDVYKRQEKRVSKDKYLNSSELNRMLQEEIEQMLVDAPESNLSLIHI